MRFRYSKTDLGVYLGHLEVMKVFERAFRRASLPIRYTEGFNPTVRLSFAAPLSVGFSSEYEIGEIVLNESIDPAVFLRLALPAGFRILEAKTVENCDSLMARLSFAVYRISVEAGPDPRPVLEKIASFAARSEFQWEKKTKSGVRTLNMMEFIANLDASVDSGVVRIAAKLRAGNQGALNPDVLAKAMLGVQTRARVHRLFLEDARGCGIYE